MSVVISLRIPRELKESLEELGVDWRREVREYLERRVREERKRRLLERAREVRRRVGRLTTDSAELIREDRDARRRG